MVALEALLDVTPDALRTRGGYKWNRYDADVLPAWVADMDFVAPEPVRARVAEMAAHSAFGYWRLDQEGRFFEAAARWIAARHGWEIAPERCALLVDVVQGINIAMHLFTEPGDGVIVQGPIYPPFLRSIEAQQRTIVDNRLIDVAGTATLDLDGLRALAAQPRTRLLLLCNPHNPSGRVLRRNELEAIATIAIEHDLIVVADEIWMDVVYPGHRHIPFASLGPEVAARTITLTSATKTFSLGGLPCALAICGSAALRERWAEWPQQLRGMPSAISIEATIAAWDGGADWFAAVLNQLDANRRRVADFFGRRLPHVRHRSPEGTYLAWLDFSACGFDQPAADVLLEHGRVALSSGVDFGADPAWARLNFATTPAILDQILERIAAVAG
jgi:cystathionine beta-lyase